MLAGAYPSDEFAELKPRVVWDRVTDVVEGRRDARVVAVTSGGTIPDRGLYRRVHGRRGGHAGPAGRRARRGDGLRAARRDARRGHRARASSWRVEDIGHDRVTVSPAPGVPGKLPFWHGDAVGRPVELGRALGAFIREVEDGPRPRRAGRATAAARLQRDPRPRRSRGLQPARLPRGRARGDRRPARPTGASSSSASATSSATGACAC